MATLTLKKPLSYETQQKLANIKPPPAAEIEVPIKPENEKEEQ